MPGQILNPGSFPPGSSAVFIDLINQLSALLDNTEQTAGTAQETAGDAAQAAQTAQQAAANAQSDANAAGVKAGTALDAAEDAQFAAGNAQQTADNLADNAVLKDVTTLQVMEGALSVGTELRISNVKVLGGRIVGWTVSTGTATKGGINADEAFTVGAEYSQTEMQAIADALVEIRRLVVALQAAATSHGLIGA